MLQFRKDLISMIQDGDAPEDVQFRVMGMKRISDKKINDLEILCTAMEAQDFFLYNFDPRGETLNVIFQSNYTRGTDTVVIEINL